MICTFLAHFFLASCISTCVCHHTNWFAQSQPNAWFSPFRHTYGYDIQTLHSLQWSNFNIFWAYITHDLHLSGTNLFSSYLLLNLLKRLLIRIFQHIDIKISKIIKFCPFILRFIGICIFWENCIHFMLIFYF